MERFHARCRIVAPLALVVTVILIAERRHKYAPQVCIQHDAAESIHVGMTEADIEARLGVPAADYRTTNRIVYVWSGPGIVGTEVSPREYRFAKTWMTDDVLIRVKFDEDLKAVDVMLQAGWPTPTWREETSDRISRWFK